MGEVSRRELIASLGVAALATAAGRNANAAEPMPSMEGMPAMKGMGMNPLVDPFPRVNPDITPSPPPATKGQQMGRVICPGQEPLGYELDGRIKVFRLTAQPVEVDITQGLTNQQIDERMNIPKEYQKFRPRVTQPKKMLAWGYNGSTCGPTLEATEGDRVRIIFRNELPEPTSIHWHGFELPFSQDGASGYYPFEARRPILPGQSEVYEFDLVQSGTLMYHSGFNAMKQEGLGLGGLFVIHPKKESNPPDKDFAILLQQWNFVPGNENPDIIIMEPTHATFNGRSFPDLPMMEVNQGDRVRIRLGNLSLLYHPIHIHGYIFEIVGTLGGPIPKSARWKDATVTIGPGETRDIELVAWNPGIWRFHCHVLHHIMNQMPLQPMGIAAVEGMFTHLKVNPRDPNYDPRSPDSKWSAPPMEERV